MTTHPTDPPTTDRPPEARTPCSDPDLCDPVTGEPCDRHETEQAHAEGEHAFCGTECEVEYPSEQLRNFILAKGYPGTAGMLDELLRRAAAGRVEPSRTDDKAPQPETQPREETGSALARHIIEQPVSVVQAALRILDWPLVFELRPAADIEERAAARQAQAAHLVEHCPDHGTSSAPWPTCRCAEAVALRQRSDAEEATNV